ncbi:hypothetical protein LJC49_11030 [Ruminococcaceae bacterium OttesenSCG-928-I18]|nr:hypothetical protein [Ruminococcaceae bacterium OttesenSCG-928-I18]
MNDEVKAMEPGHICQKQKELGQLQSDVKTIFKRIDEQMTITKAVYELAAEVKVMNERMETMAKAQQEMRDDLDELKSVPKGRWNSVVTTIITAAVAGLVAYVLLRLGLSA